MSEILDQRDLNVPGAMLTATGIQFDDGVTFDQWGAIGATLERAEHAVQWWIGDWLLYGEGRSDWGDKYEQAIAMFNRSYDTIAKYKSVAKKVESCNRLQNLPWSHHEAVAALPPEEQLEVLELAEPDAADKRPRLTTRQVKHEARKRRCESDEDVASREARNMVRQFERALCDLTEAAQWLACDDLETMTIDALRSWWASLPVE